MKKEGAPTVQLALLKQTSLTEETITSNGKTRPCHVVVKNSPFCVIFGFVSANGAPIVTNQTQPFPYDLHNYQLDIKLLYDADESKEVDFVKNTPLQTKTTLNQNGSKLTLEVRIKVLTSHMENSLFRIQVTAIDENKQSVFTATSDAVKVISKSDQVKKSKFKSSKKKRNPSDFLSDALSDMETRHQEQAKLLEMLTQTNQLLINEALTSRFTEPQLVNPNVNRVKPPPPPDFASALKNFIKASTHLTSEEKRTKIRRVASQTNVHEVIEMADMIWTEGLARENPKSERMQVQSGLMGCTCEDCSYKKELTRIEAFYDDIFLMQPGSTAPSLSIS